MKLKLIAFLLCFLLCGCDNMKTTVDNTNVNKTEAVAKIQNGAILLDVRSKEEYDAGHIDGALLLPLDDIVFKMKDLYPDQNKTYIVYCQSGNRSNMALQRLKDMGYEHVYDLGSIKNWRD